MMEYIDNIKREIEKYTKSIFRIIVENGVNVKTTPITFVGGGVGLIKKYAGLNQRNISYDVRNMRDKIYAHNGKTLYRDWNFDKKSILVTIIKCRDTC